MNEMSKIKRNPAAVKIANEILKEYDCDSLADMQDALKEIFGPLFEGMLQGEMDNHLGYKSNSKEPKSTKNRRNGSNPKTLKTTMGEVEINAPRDRNGSFEPVIVPKRSKDVSDIEGKVLSMYARGMSQRDISSTIEDIYGFKVSQYDLGYNQCYPSRSGRMAEQTAQKMLPICFCRLYVCFCQKRL